MTVWNSDIIESDALEIERLASEWLERKSFGDWGSHEQTELNAWLSQSLAHEIAFLRLEAGWGRTKRLAALRSRKTENRTAEGKRAGKTLSIGIAIVLAFAAFGVAGWAYLIASSRVIYSTPIGGHKTITLADGSKIELNTDTFVRAYIGSGSREIELLKGEAYFQIKHDRAKPFVVTAAGHRIMDLGTKFVIRSDRGRLQVTLLEGRVALNSAEASAGTRPVILLPGEIAIASGGAFSVIKSSANALSASLGWRSGMLVFQDATLDDAAAEFNRYNTKKLVIADTSAGRRVIGAAFPVNRTDLFANAVRNVLGLRVVERGDEIVISR